MGGVASQRCGAGQGTRTGAALARECRLDRGLERDDKVLLLGVLGRHAVRAGRAAPPIVALDTDLLRPRHR